MCEAISHPMCAIGVRLVCDVCGPVDYLIEEKTMSKMSVAYTNTCHLI
jgi:hypothetical protein